MSRIRERRTGRRDPGGFSLIELLLVLVILGTLAAIIVPKFVGRSEDARITAARQDIRSIETALEGFEVDCGRFPTTQEGLVALYEQPQGLDRWKGYLKKGLPKDPWGNPYVYSSPGTHNDDTYDLFSYGPDGQEGGGDDIVNWSED